MKVVLQRVKEASVIIDGHVYSSINKGYLLLVGFTHNDDFNLVKRIAKKIYNLRIFSDENDKMNRSIKDVCGQILSVSQFTLYADTNSGNRPSFTKSMSFNDAKKLYEQFNDELRNYNVDIKTGVFGAMMDVNLVNDGPVTIIYDEQLEN